MWSEHHDHHGHDHSHDPGVSSVSIVCEGSLDLEKVVLSFCCNSYIYATSHGRLVGKHKAA